MAHSYGGIQPLRHIERAKKNKKCKNFTTPIRIPPLKI